MTRQWGGSSDRSSIGPLQEVDGGLLLHVTAFPKAKRNEIAGVRNGRLLVKVTAPPEDGKANEAIVKLLAKALGLAVRNVEVISGATSRQKSLLLNGVSLADATKVLLT